MQCKHIYIYSAWKTGQDIFLPSKKFVVSFYIYIYIYLLGFAAKGLSDTTGPTVEYSQLKDVNWKHV